MLISILRAFVINKSEIQNKNVGMTN